MFLGNVLKKCVVGVCEALIGQEERLNELDRGSGDGDCGTTLKAGAMGEHSVDPPVSLRIEQRISERLILAVLAGSTFFPLNVTVAQVLTLN